MPAFNGGRESVVAQHLGFARPIGWWPRVVVLFGVVLTAMGAVIALVHPAMLVSPHDEINGAVHIYAGYLAARNFALAGMLLVLIAMALTPAHRAEFWTSAISIVAVLLTYVVFRRGRAGALSTMHATR